MTRFTLVGACLCLLAVPACKGRSSPAARLGALKSQYEAVVAGVRDGRIAPDQNGVATLPADLGAASEGGEVLVASRNGLLLVAFRTWRGKAFNMRGFLYSSRPLAAAELVKDYYGNNTVAIGPAPLTIDQQIEPNWYAVSRSED